MGEENNLLTAWQRKFAFDLGLRVSRGISISDRQSSYAEQFVEEAFRHGCKIRERGEQ